MQWITSEKMEAVYGQVFSFQEWYYFNSHLEFVGSVSKFRKSPTYVAYVLCNQKTFLSKTFEEAKAFVENEYKNAQIEGSL